RKIGPELTELAGPALDFLMGPLQAGDLGRQRLLASSNSFLRRFELAHERRCGQLLCFELGLDPAQPLPEIADGGETGLGSTPLGVGLTDQGLKTLRNLDVLDQCVPADEWPGRIDRCVLGRQQGWIAADLNRGVGLCGRLWLVLPVVLETLVARVALVEREPVRRIFDRFENGSR